jgi:HNH endonuclease/AP2 domain
MPYKKRRVKRHAVTQPSDLSYRLIPLTQNQNATVDAEDFDRLSTWDWHARYEPRGEKFYAQRKGPAPEYKIILMHREILGCDDTHEPDHRNGNSLDNRKSNLRTSTHAQNIRNKRLGRDNTSGFIGAWKSKGRWASGITHDRQRFYLGYFDSALEAAMAYDAAAKKLHGEFARLNFPNQSP